MIGQTYVGIVNHAIVRKPFEKMVDSAMLKSPTTEDIVAYVVKWVERRYKDDEYISVALEATINALRAIRHEDNTLGYVMRSVYRACKAHRVVRDGPLPNQLENIASTDLDLEECGLTTQEKLVVRDKIQHDKTYEEIGIEMNLTYVQVRYIYYGAINKLRKKYVNDDFAAYTRSCSKR